jgi:hypothetical protein
MHAENKEDDAFYLKYGRGIVERYRERAIKRFGKDFFNKENHNGAPFPVGRKK